MPEVKVATFVPKTQLIEAIKTYIPEDCIRTSLNMQVNSDIDSKLNNLKKADLLSLLLSFPEGKLELENLETEFPIGSAPTFYVVRIGTFNAEDILKTSEILAKSSVDRAYFGGRKNSVRRVYMIKQANFYSDVLEIPLVYDLKFEYTVADESAKEYTELCSEYSLQNACIWVLKGHSHAIIFCSDFAALNPIISYCQEHLNITLNSMNFDNKTIDELSAEAMPRTATFSKLELEESDNKNTQDNLDVQTIILSDPNLRDKVILGELEKSKNRRRTAKFFSKHPNIPKGGIGFASRYSRVWIPSHLGREYLMQVASTFLKIIEDKMEKERSNDLKHYCSNYSTKMFKIGNTIIRGKSCQVFSDLVTNIAEAINTGNQTTEIALPPEFIKSLVRFQDSLQLHAMVELDCNNCINSLAYCPKCSGIPLEVKMISGAIVAKCPRCSFKAIDSFECDCGENIHIQNLCNHISIMPSKRLIDALNERLTYLGISKLKGTFVILGGVLRLFSFQTPKLKPLISLNDLNYWRATAHFHTGKISLNDDHLKKLKSLKEKCRNTNYHPSGNDCSDCLENYFFDFKHMCLPKLFGIPINKKFDGIHHGYEFADIKYQDSINNTDNTQYEIAIHIKSYQSTEPINGLGRTNNAIKGLYTQVCYCSYLVMRGIKAVDVIGIAIPNNIQAEVKTSLQDVVNMSGISFLVIDKNDWLKIIDAVNGNINFSNTG